MYVYSAIKFLKIKSQSRKCLHKFKLLYYIENSLIEPSYNTVGLMLYENKSNKSIRAIRVSNKLPRRYVGDEFLISHKS